MINKFQNEHNGSSKDFNSGSEPNILLMSSAKHLRCRTINTVKS